MRIVLLLASCLLTMGIGASESLRKSQKEGQTWGKENAKFAIEQVKEFSSEDIKPPGAEPFDADIAKSQVKHEESVQSETLQFLQSPEVQKNERENRRINEDEYFIKQSEAIANGTVQSTKGVVEEKTEYTYEVCQEAEAPSPISLFRTLEVEMVHEPEQKNEVKVCRGHKTKTHFFWKRDAEDWVDKKKKQLSADSTIQNYDAYIDRNSGGMTEKYCVRAEWKHHDDAETCKKFKKETKVVKPEQVEEKSEKWVYSNESTLELSKSPDCVLFEKTCLDASPRNISGKEIYKQCWKEKLSYLCQLPKSKQCLILREKNCEEISRKCLKDGLHGCALWEITYRCFKALSRNFLLNDQQIFGLSEGGEGYEPNKSFAEVYTKLSIFDEIKRQLEQQDIADASKIQLFKGKQMSCSKSVADQLMYDCCFSYGGLANTLKLSQCNEEEITLGEMREKGLCHYVGKYEEKMLKLWKSSDVHVFCCFPTKLARVFQEEARDQLKMDWGKPKDPDCRGFFQKEIGQMDFSKLDLAEVYDKQSKELEERLEHKLKSLTTQLQERMENEK